ncbi:MAG: WbqC family protein, partial [Gemmatimonadota bacterium]|nr:WbqC family protein [Gemmatimonadota bacterium]
GTRFLNPPGGRGIYRSDEFSAHGIELAFLDPELPRYPQDGAREFVPALSILDVLLRNPREQVRAMVQLGREAAA